MAFGFKNAGIIVGVICSVIISLISLHVQHILLDIAEFIRAKDNSDHPPDYALTMEKAFLCSENPIIRKSAGIFKRTCNVFICLTQFGFCCVYLKVQEYLHTFTITSWTLDKLQIVLFNKFFSVRIF